MYVFSRSPITSSSTLSRIAACNDSVCLDYFDLKLTSVFQPIFSFAHKQPVGYEALLRAWTPGEQQIFPDELFSIVHNRDDLALLEDRARDVHLRNFVMQHPGNTWLFLNMTPKAFIEAPRQHDPTAQHATLMGLNPFRVVVEVVESQIDDEDALTAAVQHYRSQGCLVALDDFGTGHSNFGRVWSIEPEIVKLDRQLTRGSVTSRRTRRMLANLVNMLHESGCLVVMEGVETENEALLAIDVDADMAQGFYFARPEARVRIPSSYTVTPSDLVRKHRDLNMRTEQAAWRRWLQRPLHTFQESSHELALEQPIDAACFRLLRQEGVECVYLLDQNGAQVGLTLAAPAGSKICDPRYAPLLNSDGANWFKRPFFQTAIHNPGQVQISSPYLSLTGAYLCVTLSIAITISGATHVFCCDVNWDRFTRV